MSGGRQAVAPCGHMGVVVVGTYVQCQQCESKPQGTAKKRGVAGHVDMCACPHCTARRRGRTIVLRTQDGKQVETSWDGINDTLRFRSKVDGTLRHWRLLDDDGDTILDGMCDVTVTTDEDIIINFQWLLPTASLAVSTELSDKYYAMYNPAYDLGVYELYAKRVAELQKKMAEAMSLPEHYLTGLKAEPDLQKRWWKPKSDAVEYKYTKDGHPYYNLKSKALIPIDTETREECPRRWYYKYKDLRPEGESIAARVGTLVHKHYEKALGEGDRCWAAEDAKDLEWNKWRQAAKSANFGIHDEFQGRMRAREDVKTISSDRFRAGFKVIDHAGTEHEVQPVGYAGNHEEHDWGIGESGQVWRKSPMQKVEEAVGYAERSVTIIGPTQWDNAALVENDRKYVRGILAKSLKGRLREVDVLVEADTECKEFLATVKYKASDGEARYICTRVRAR